MAPVDSAALHAIDPVPSTTPPPRLPHTRVTFSQTRLRRAQIYVRPHTPPSPSTEALIAEYASTPTPSSPPTSPLSPLSSLLLRIPSPPLLLPPLHTIPTYASAPLGYRAAMVHDIHEAEMPPWKRVCFIAPTRRFEVRESSTAVAARQTGHTLARRVNYGFIDTLDSSIRVSKGRVMTVVGEVNERVTNFSTTQRQDTHELYAWSRSEDRSTTLEASIRTLEAQVRTLQTQHDRMEWQRQDVGDLVTTAFGRIHALEARDRARTRDAGHQDGPADAGSSC
ncbi:hypothetical protein Tco_1488748 [Tanacetum coccineum]